MLGQRRFGKVQMAVLVIIALVVGANLISPAVAHFRPKIGHLVKHVFAKADPRYINVGEAAGGSLTGTYPNPTLAANSVGSAQIADNAVTTSEIADGSLTGTEIADGSLGSADLGTNSVGSSEIGITTGSASTVVIPGGAAENAAYNTGVVSATCPAGTEIFGASIDWLLVAAGDEVWISESIRSSSTTWFVRGGNDSGTDRTLSVTPLCFIAT